MSTNKIFNKSSRTSNVLKTSGIGMISTVLTTLLAFGYRTVFIYILSASYLGVEGLFSNILKMLSLAELGISTAIVYRFYEPISRNDVEKVGQLLRFFKMVYAVIATVILLVGLSILPFLHVFIKDISEVPPDINLHLIYVLYLLMQVSTYLFSYKLTILTADQKQYIVSIFNVVVKVATCVAQIIALIIWKNFVLSLILNIAITLASNIVMSTLVEHQYKEAFSVKTMLPKDERQRIYKDTFATLCHKIGGIIANGTDSIIISSFIGITVAGIYSNYHMVIYSIITIMQQVTGNFTSSLGNAAVEKTGDEQFKDYKKLLFATLWISSYVTTCVYVLIDKFILIWTNKPEMVLDEFTVILISIMLFTDIIRYITTSYINGNGLFVKDKIRPLIEATINLVVSILAVKIFGLAGVFIGTIVSRICTTMWREPYLVFKYVFGKSMMYYWRIVFAFAICVIAIGGTLKFGFYKLDIPTNILTWILEGIICTVLFNVILLLVFRKNSDFQFFKNKITKATRMRKKITKFN